VSTLSLPKGEQNLLREKSIMDVRTRLSSKERDELESLMEARNPDGPLADTITRLHGFLTSVVSGPMVVPSEWMPTIFGNQDDRVWETMDQARHAMSLVMRFYNEVASDLTRGGRQYGILIDRIGDRLDTLDLADDWCKGYLLGISLRESEWKEAMDDPELSRSFDPIFAIASPETVGREPLNDREKYDELLDMLPDCSIEIYEWWRKKLIASMQAPSGQAYSGTVRRAVPKVSPNAPCPCGSGKKYKRCCSVLRAV
jgi:uncharacterized protein